MAVSLKEWCEPNNGYVPGTCDTIAAALLLNSFKLSTGVDGFSRNSTTGVSIAGTPREQWHYLCGIKA